MEQETETFAELIAPLPVEEFLADYWEQTYLHQRNPPGRFDRYFSLAEIDRWLTATRSGIVFTLVPDCGGLLRTEVHRVADLAPGAVYAHLKQGYAQIFKGMADWPSLVGLAKSLAREFHADVHVNAFLTPAGATTYPAYTAHDDVLVLQLEGEEVWNLQEFSLLQLHLAEKNHLDFPEEWYFRTRTPVRAQVRMTPGDLLFVPRGMPHHVVSPERMSFHLRLYVTPLCWMNLLKIAAEHAALHSQVLRQALPPGFVESDEVGERMRTTFAQAMEVFRQVEFEAVLAAVRRNRVAKQGFPADGQFAHLVGAAELTADSEVERRPGVLCTVNEIVDTERNPRSAIFFGDGQVAGPPHLRRALEFIRDHVRFRVSEIPGLDELGKLVLARRLIADGLLRRAR